MGAHKQVAANCDDNERRWRRWRWRWRRQLLVKKAHREGGGEGVGRGGKLARVAQHFCAQLCRRRVKRMVLFAARGKHFNRCPTMPATFCALSRLVTFFPHCVCVCCPSASSSSTLYSPATPCPAPLCWGLSCHCARHGTAKHMTPCTSQCRLRRRGRCRSLPAPRAAIRTRTSHVAAPLLAPSPSSFCFSLSGSVKCVGVACSLSYSDHFFTRKFLCLFFSTRRKDQSHNGAW